MKVLLIGSFGFENIWDRSLFAGILSMLKDKISELNIGSQLPFYTERFIVEDENFIRNYGGYNNSINLFDIRNIFELRKFISNSEILILAGSSLDFSNNLYVLAYAMKFARLKRKKTFNFSPNIINYNKRFNKNLKKIINNSDILIFPNNNFEAFSSLAENKFGIKINSNKMVELYCPLKYILHSYKQQYIKNKQKNKQFDLIVDILTIRKNNDEFNNLDYKQNYYNKLIISKINEFNGSVLYLPNNYFFLKEDERNWYNELKINNIILKGDIQNRPLNIEKTFEIILNCKMSIGINYASILAQNILNGNNYVIEQNGINFEYNSQICDTNYVTTIDQNSIKNIDFNLLINNKANIVPPPDFFKEKDNLNSILNLNF